MMKLLIVIALLSVGYCSENNENNQKAETRIAGGGNYGGFIGLTTYGGGPFLVKGKYEKDLESNDDRKQREVSIEDYSKNKNNDRVEGYDDIKSSESETIENIRKEQSSHDGDNKKDNVIEYLGYDGDGCIGQYERDNRYGNRDKYGRQRYRDGNRSSQRRGNYSDYYDDATRDRCDEIFGYTGPTANDEPENLMRPCALDDWQCIRKFFAANSNCKPAYGPIPDPLFLDVNTVFFSTVNISVALPNLRVRGLSSARIRDFYVNKESGNLVFVIDVTNLNETIPRAYFRYRRTAKESIVLADYATVEYGAITFTAVIPKVPHLRLDLADVHADVQDAVPPFFVGPGAANSTDPDVITAFTQFVLQIPLIIREGFLFQAQLFTSIYIQKNICDFGLQIISV